MPAVHDQLRITSRLLRYGEFIHSKLVDKIGLRKDSRNRKPYCLVPNAYCLSAIFVPWCLCGENLRKNLLDRIAELLHPVVGTVIVHADSHAEV